MFISPSAYPLGGLATWLDYLVPGLRERDWNVTLGLVEGRFHDVDAYLDIHPDKQVLRIPHGTGTREGRVRQLLRAICSARPDIVVAVNIADVALAIDRIRAMLEWSPSIAVALHALQADLIRHIGHCAGLIDGVVCTNRLACEMVARGTSVEADRIYYAPCGVNINSPTASGRQDSEGILRIAYVGRLDRAEKRIEDIGAIVDELDHRGVAYELVIAGGGPHEDWLQLRLSDAVKRGRVRFLGKLPNADLAEQVYSRLDALLVTSPCETGPIVAWEAMAHGTIVVTSAYLGSGLEGSLASGVNCLMFPIGDAAGAADCLERLRDSGLRARLRRGGFGLVAERYSTEISIGQWNASLRDIAARSPLPLGRRITTMAQPPPAGRLDRLFGPDVAETIRELFRLKYDHCNSGGEWPHSYVYSQVDEEAFGQLATSLDRVGRAQSWKPIQTFHGASLECS